MTSLHAEDFDLIRRDTALPGLRLLLDPDALAAELGGAGGGDGFGTLELDYVRYKPGVNAIGRYRLTTGGQVHLAYAKAFGADAAVKLAKLEDRGGTGLQCLSARGLAFLRFPADARLRSIERLGDDSARGRLFGRIFKHDPDWQTADFEVLNYKPERRLVCRLDRPDGCRAVVKFHAPAEFARSLHLRRNRHLDRELPLPRYIGGSRKHGVHAFDWVPGESLRTVTLDTAGDIGLYREAGALLARLHASDPQGLEARPQARFYDALRGTAELLAHILPDCRNAADSLVQDLQRLAVLAADGRCAVHADFYDKQVIAGPGGLCLIDLDQARLGDPAEDLGCFMAHLEMMQLCLGQPGRQRLDAGTAELMQGYLCAGGHVSETELVAWTALSLFQLSHQPFRNREADWPARTRAVLRRARSILDAAGGPVQPN